MIIQNTLLLDQDAWDLVLDANGDIALAGAPYSIAQDVASATRTFLGECWYDNALGIPYWRDTLGYLPPMSLVRQRIIDQAMTIQNVVTADVSFTAFENRQLTGNIYIIDTDGAENNISLGDIQ